MAFGIMSAHAYAADENSSKIRYNAVKEDTKNTGSVGFDKRHKAYRDYVMEQRRDNDVANIAPAAGSETQTVTKKDVAETGSQPSLND